MSLNMFISHSVADFSKKHDDCYQHSSSSTKTTFIQGLKRIEKIWGKNLCELKLEFLNDPNDFLTKLEESNYSANTNLSTLTQTVKLLKILDAPLSTYNGFLKLLKDKTIVREAERNTNIIVSIQQKPSLEVLQNKILETNPADIETYEELRMLLLVSLYTLSLPIKIRNYVGMKYYNRLDGGDGYTGNYIIKNTLHIKNYKTGNSKSVRNIKITNDFLKTLLELWEEMNPHVHFLSNSSGREMLQKDVNTTLALAGRHYFGLTLNVEDYRHLFIKDELDRDPSLRDKIELSKSLGYGSMNMVDNMTELF